MKKIIIHYFLWKILIYKFQSDPIFIFYLSFLLDSGELHGVPCDIHLTSSICNWDKLGK